MELRHLEYFVAVAEELSFTKAAERLSMAQSPISQQVQKLERELGVQLFSRTTRSVDLTSAGRILYEDALDLLASAKRAAEHARLAGQGRVGRLTLAFGGTATYDLMPQLVSTYAQRYPDVTLEVRSEMLTQPQVSGLLDGSITVGLLRPPVLAEGLAIEVLREEPLVALLPVNHRLASRSSLTLEDLHDEDFISYPSSPPSSVYQIVTAACRHAGFIPRIRQEVAETSSLVALVAAGLGVALAPASIRQLRIAGATHRPVRGSDAALTLALAYKSGPTSPIVRNYLDVVRAVVRKQRPVSAGLKLDGPDIYLPDTV
jgi:DNA-binding transcriptional LysR family regulator